MTTYKIVRMFQRDGTAKRAAADNRDETHLTRLF